MSDEFELKAAQRSVLLLLMAEGSIVPNATIVNNYRFKLSVEDRDDLVQKRLIDVKLVDRRLQLVLTDKGWVWCTGQFSAKVPNGGGHGGGATYAILAALKRYLERTRNDIEGVFPQVGSESPTVESIEARIRKLYGELSSGAGGSVLLSDLRDELGGIDRSLVNEALIVMSQAPDVSILPEANQKRLTQRDREAAISIGNQLKYKMVIGS